MPQEEKKDQKVEATNGQPEKKDNDVVVIDGMRYSRHLVIINENHYPVPVLEPAPNPMPKMCYSPTPINVVTQQTVSGDNHSFPNWVIGLIVAILLLMLIFGGYTLYQSGKDATPAPAPTPTVKVINSRGSKTAVDPEARVSAAEANMKADFNSQKISDLEEQERQRQLAEEKNKKDCNSSGLLTF